MIQSSKNKWKYTLRFFMKLFARLCTLLVPSPGLRKTIRSAFDRKIVRLFRSEIEMFVEKYPPVLTEAETLQLIIEQKLSIARFGDGEFKLMVGERHKSFQDVNQELNRRLKEVLKSQNASLLVAIQAVRTFEQLSLVWRKFIIRIGDPVIDLLDPEREYASTGVFREIHTNDSDSLIKKICTIKKLWEAKDVVFVVGRDSRFKFEKELFNNCRSVAYIYGPAKNAFSHYEELMSQVRKYDKNKHLILIALGPTATVMAHDLALEGYQAIDFGQMPGQFREARQRFFKDDDLSGLEKVHTSGFAKKNKSTAITKLKQQPINS